jgi:hypothetical protein
MLAPSMDAEQRLSHSVTGEADSRRSSQGIRSGSEVSVERKRIREVVVLAEDLLYTHEPEVDGILSQRFDEVNIHCADGSMVGDSLRVPAEWAELGDPISEIDGRKQGILLVDIRRKSESGRGVETDRLIGRGFMPNLDARSDVHGEGGAEDPREPRPHAPAVVGPLIALACRIGSPVIGRRRSLPLLVGVAEIGVGIVVDIVVDPDPVLVPIRGRLSGQNQVVGHIAWLCAAGK